MFESMMSPDLPNHLYAELIRRREQDRLARRVTRQRAMDRAAARSREQRPAQPRPVARPEAETACPAVQ